MGEATLTIAAPLAIEAAALRGSGGSQGPGTRIVRVGVGARRAGAAAARLSAAARESAARESAARESAARESAARESVAREETGAGPAVHVVAGVAGALVADLSPGDLVVANQVLSADGRPVREVPGAALLAATLRRKGLRVRVGPVISVDHVARGGPARRALAGFGALVVDMESAALAAGLPQGPFGVVRAVVDTPGQELLSPATLTGGVAALLTLRAARPALEAWAAAAAPRRVLLAEPRSFCAGVERAIHTVERAIDRFGSPVYVRRQIVHNRHVVNDLEGRGAVFVEELEQVPEGATVVYSAHGVGRTVQAEAAARKLRVVDATCPLVAKVHNEVRRFTAAGRQVVLVGHPGHDEVLGTLDQADGVLLAERAEEVADLEVRDPSRLAYTTQTTLSPADVEGVVGALRARWPEIVGPAATDICYATHNRQAAVEAIASRCDLLLVIGSANSSNSRRLVEVASRTGARSELIDDVGDVDPAWLAGARSVGVTAGASAPDFLVTELVQNLVALGATDVETNTATTESVAFSLPPEVR
jgi:4-hydroxy-3-methylbut-2-en-1-yl diphosphate reductase